MCLWTTVQLYGTEENPVSQEIQIHIHRFKSLFVWVFSWHQSPLCKMQIFCRRQHWHKHTPPTHTRTLHLSIHSNLETEVTHPHPVKKKCCLPVSSVLLCTICQYLLPIHVTANSSRVWRSWGAPRCEERDSPSVTKTKSKSQSQRGHSSQPPVTELLIASGAVLKHSRVVRHVWWEKEVRKSRSGMLPVSAVNRQWFQWVAFASFRECNGADPSLWLHFTCFMVNKSSQDFRGLVST